MKILKLKGKSEETILKEIEKEYGEKAFVLDTSKETLTGIAKWLKPSRTVITIAVKEESDGAEQVGSDINNVSNNVLNIVTEKDKSKEYDVLLELKDQISNLQKEVLEITKVSSNEIIKSDNKEDNTVKNEWYDYIYNKLIQTGIKENICKELLEGVDKLELEEIIENVYSKLELILKKNKDTNTPQIVFFIGSTGVGKTTTLAKLTAKYVLDEQKKVVLFTADTYRIAAVEQLKTYADILGVEIEVIYNETELPKYIEKWKDADCILIDTAGRSHKNIEQVKELKLLMDNVEQKKVFLVLNVNTSYSDVGSIINTYEKVTTEFDLILTKLDETDAIGNLVNIASYSNRAIMYTTNGQNVPSDIELFKEDDYITELLGRINHE